MSVDFLGVHAKILDAWQEGTGFKKSRFADAMLQWCFGSEEKSVAERSNDD